MVKEGLTDGLIGEFVGHNHREVADLSLIDLCNGAVDVGVGGDEKSQLFGPVNGLGVELAIVHHLNAVNQPLAVNPVLKGVSVKAFAPPTGVIVHNDCALCSCVAYGNFGVFIVDGVVVGREKTVEVSILGGVARKFNAPDEHNVLSLGGRHGGVVR